MIPTIMALLSSVLAHVPDEWDDCNYNYQRFKRITLQKYTSEYQQLENEFLRNFSNVTVVSIERIQHPFAYGRFQIRKEQLTILNREVPQQNRKFLLITDANKINDILEYNCDGRRGGYYCGPINLTSGYALVVKMLGYNFDERDTHRYPEYLIQYNKNSASNYNPQRMSSRNLSDLNDMIEHLSIY